MRSLELGGRGGVPFSVKERKALEEGCVEELKADRSRKYNATKKANADAK